MVALVRAHGRLPLLGRSTQVLMHAHYGSWYRTPTTELCGV